MDGKRWPHGSPSTRGGLVPEARILPVALVPREADTKYGRKTFWNVSVQTPEDNVSWNVGASKKLADALEAKLNQLVTVEYEETKRDKWLNRKIVAVDGVKSGGLGGAPSFDASPIVAELQLIRQVLKERLPSVGAGRAAGLPKSGGADSASVIPAPAPTPQSGGPTDGPGSESVGPPDIPVEIWDAMFGAAPGKSSMWRRATLMGFLSELGGEWPNLTSEAGVALMDRIANLAQMKAFVTETSRGG